MVGFSSLKHLDGYLPIEDHGLIGDGTTAALVGRDGAVSWLCIPRFDSPPLFCRILDAKRGGAFTVTPVDLTESRQYYEADSGVLVTEMRNHSALIRLTDALTFRSGADLTEDSPADRSELLRCVSVLHGQVRLRIEIEPRGGAEAEKAGGGLRLRCIQRPELELQLSSSVSIDDLRTVHELKAGDRLHLILRWGEALTVINQFLRTTCYKRQSALGAAG